MEKNRLYIIFLIFILFIGLYLRMYQLGRYSLWFDEASSVLSADYMKTMVEKMGIFEAAEDRYPSFLSNLFIYFWQHLGRDEFTLRIPAVIFGVLSIFVIYRLGNSLFCERTGLLAALILTISPFHIYYSREVRMYSLVALTALLSVYFFINILRYNRMRFWLGYIAFNLISIYTHYMTVFVLLAEVVFFLIYYKRFRHLFKRWLASHILLSLFLIPWLINVISLLRIMLIEKGDYLWVPRWARSVSLKNIFYTFKNFNAGYNVTERIYVPIIVIFSLLLVLGLVKKTKREANVLLLCCFLVPVLSMYTISKIKVWYVDRYVLPSAMFYYLLVANGLSKLRNKYAIPVLCSIVILNGFGIRNYYRDVFPERMTCVGVGTKKDYRQASKYIMDNFQDGDVIFHVDHCATRPFEYYFRMRDMGKAEGLTAKSIVLKFNKETGKVAPFKFKEQGVKFIDSDISIENQKRVWLVYSSFIFDYIINFDTKKLPDEWRIRDYIEKLYLKKDTKEFKEIIVYLYRKKDNL